MNLRTPDRAQNDVSGKQHASVSNGMRCVPLLALSLALAGCLADDVDPAKLDGTFAIGGEIQGLSAEGLVLELNGEETIDVEGDGSFTFDQTLVNGSVYEVSIQSHPADQHCAVTNATGIVDDSGDVTDIDVSCEAFAARSETGVGAVELQWDGGPETVDLIYSSESDCDWHNYSVCADSGRIVDVDGGEAALTVADGLEPTVDYHFVVAADGNFSNVVAGAPQSPTFDNSVRLARQVDEQLIVGGGFNYAGIASRGMARLHEDNYALSGNIPYVRGEVYAAAADGEGGWYIGGDFEAVNGHERPGLARIRADGSVDRDWVLAADDDVNALAVAGDRVFIGGDFNRISGFDREKIASVHAESGALQPWNPPVEREVQALEVHGDALYVGSEGLLSEFPEREYAAAFDLTSGELTDWDPRPDDDIFALAARGDTLWLGGDFRELDGDSDIEYLGAVDAATGEARDWKPELDDEVFAIAIGEDRIFAGGDFEEDQQGGEFLAAFDRDSGDLASDWDDPGLDDAVQALHYRDGILHAGGDFTVPGMDQQYLAAFTDTGDPVVGRDARLDDEVHELTSSEAGILHAWGEFELSARGGESNLLALDPETGRLEEALPESVGSFGRYRDLAVDDERLYLGGTFDEVGGVSRDNLVALDRDALVVDATFDPGTDFDDRVESVAADGTHVVAAGAFEPEPQEHVIAYDSAGNPRGWDPGVDNLSPRAMMAHLHDEVLYVSGLFDEIDGLNQDLVAFDASNTDLDTNTDWDPGLGRRVVDMEGDGDLVFLGGRFSGVGDADFQGIVPIYAPGHPDAAEPAENWQGSVDDDVWGVARLGDAVYVGGDFLAASDGEGEYSQRYAAAFDVGDGSVRRDWAPEFDDEIDGMEAGDDLLMVFGDFYRVNGNSRIEFAVIDPETGDLLW